MMRHFKHREKSQSFVLVDWLVFLEDWKAARELMERGQNRVLAPKLW